MNWKNFKLSVDDRRWAWIDMDREGKSVNAVCPDFLAELDTVVSFLEGVNDYEKVIFRSAKKGSYIVGADLEAFAKMGQGPDGEKFITKGQEVFKRLENLDTPTVALIDGFCFGGGFEFALACHHRVAIESKTTKMGFPEVKLGIQPGWGGTVRSMRHNDPQKTFDIILSGKTLDAKKAKKLNLVDIVVPERLVQGALESIKKKKGPKITWKNIFMNLAPVRNMLSSVINKKLSEKVQKEHYPAPFAMVQQWKEVGHLSDKAYKYELESIIKLMKTSTARNLVSVFFLSEALKKQVPKDIDNLSHVHVIGSGVMGGDIAFWSAHKGLKVTVQDLNPQACESMAKRISKFAQKRYKRKSDKDRFLDNIVIDIHGHGLKSCDLVIEAVSENIELKKKILKDAEQRCRPETIIATNTSTIPLEDIDDVFDDPSRFIGVHFFNPVPKMPLVEIVVGNKTSAATTKNCLKYVGQIDKFPLKVKSAPGFLVNRILLPYMMEAIKLHQEGMPLEVIDKAALNFGMPMGPVELADTVGLDVTIAALTSLKGAESVPVIVQKKVNSGDLGKKSGKGFYSYKKGKAIKSKETKSDKIYECQQRLVLSLCNEAASAWREGIVDSIDELNAGSIFGFGFPPFKGGIMSYIQEQGANEIKDKLQQHSDKFGERFTPDLAFESLKEALVS